MSCGADGLSMSVAGEVGMGIRSPLDESCPLRRCEGGEVGPSLLGVGGLVFLPRLRPGVDVGEDIVDAISLLACASDCCRSGAKLRVT